MEQAPAMPTTSPVQAAPLLCSYCHQPLLPTYYFCPNCGTKVNGGDLSVSPEAQALLYAHSAVLPVILFITISQWKGLKYYRSKDEKTKKVGTIAIAIFSISIIVTLWLTYVLTEDTIQSTVSGLNADMSASGNGS